MKNFDEKKFLEMVNEDNNSDYETMDEFYNGVWQEDLDLYFEMYEEKYN